MLKPLIIAALAVTAASPALADTVTATPSKVADKTKDPNRKICEKVEKIGSRLNIVRVCMTARQWEEQKRAHREDFERVQRVVNQAPAN